MPVEQLLPDDHPMIIAWKAYSETGDYDNTRNWAKHDKHVDGSLWAAFAKGYEASAPTLAAENAALKALVAEMVEGIPDLFAVTSWLQNGCSPETAVIELKLYQKRIDALITRAKEAVS